MYVSLAKTSSSFRTFKKYHESLSGFNQFENNFNQKNNSTNKIIGTANADGHF